ncbi:hypothetical protein ACLMJK_004787 [Lecanora helva]
MHVLDGQSGGLGLLQSPQPILPSAPFMTGSVQNTNIQPLLTNRNAASRVSTRRNQHSQPSASCALCRRRKVKCDRNSPCGSCARAGVECVPSAPSQAPRGRQGGRKRRTDGELLERIAKLEGLVKNVEGTTEHGMTPHRRNTTTTEGLKGGVLHNANSLSQDRTNIINNGAPNDKNPTSGSAGSGLDRYLGSSFWETLSDEINGLKDVLGGSSDEEEELEDGPTPESNHSSSKPQMMQNQSSDSSFVMSLLTPSEHPETPTPHQLYVLCDTYLTNVDPVFKVLHTPSLRKHLQEGAAELPCSPGPRGLEALKFAICFAASTSMTSEECRHRLGEERDTLTARYRAGTELELARADFLNTDEMSTLQALAIYLASVRVNDKRRLTWTLTSLAVRIAQAMNLHHEPSSNALSPFDREMRRRLWWQICLLDSHAAEDRATNPVVYADSFSTKLPLRLNDGDLHFNSFEEVREREGFTDMTFCLVCHEIMDVARQLNYVPAKELGQPQSESQDKSNTRVDAVINAQRRIEERYLRHLNIARPFHWVTRIVADIITANMWLIVFRPLQKRRNSSNSSQLPHPGIMGLSVEVLERTHLMSTDPAASPFRWLAQTYVQWHALAVTVAELCDKTEGPVVERAWAIIKPVFDDASKHVADSNMGMLWRPIKKLMNRAQGLRQEYLDSQTVETNSTSVEVTRTANDQNKIHAAAGDCTFGADADRQSYMEGITTSMEGLHSTPSASDPAPFDWNPWLAAASTSVVPTMQSGYNDVDQTAWTNWESFVDGFQGEDVLLQGQNAESTDMSNFWP